MSRRKLATTVYVRPDQERDLHTLSQATGRPVAQLIREGIDLALRRHAGAMPQSIPAPLRAWQAPEVPDAPR